MILLNYQRLLAAGTAVLFGAAAGYATTVAAQTPGPPATGPSQGSTVPIGGDERATPPLSTRAESNFSRDRNIAVLQHPREGYEARGIRVGTFLVFPKVALTAERNDNIYASSTNEVDDTVWHVAPEVTFNSDWNRHQVFGYARAIANRFQDNSRENTTDYLLGIAGRLDVTRDARINGRLDWSHLTEPRTSPNAPPANVPGGASEPVQYDLLAVSLDGRREFNRLMASARFNSQKFDYDSPSRIGGGVVDQSFRDRTVSTVAGRLDYAVSPATAVFVEVAGNHHDYRSRSVTSPINRDSDGTQALVGLNFELGNLSRGEIGVGYLRQSFNASRTKDLKGFGARAQLEWFPTQLTTVTLDGSRSIEDSAVPGSPAYLSSNVGARVDHELLRNVILSGYARHGRDEYTGIVREDNRNSAGLSATYLVNRSVGLMVSYDHTEQKTEKGIGNTFKVNRLGATLTLQY